MPVPDFANSFPINLALCCQADKNYKIKIEIYFLENAFFKLLMLKNGGSTRKPAKIGISSQLAGPLHLYRIQIITVGFR